MGLVGKAREDAAERERDVIYQNNIKEYFAHIFIGITPPGLYWGPWYWTSIISDILEGLTGCVVVTSVRSFARRACILCADSISQTKKGDRQWIIQVSLVYIKYRKRREIGNWTRQRITGSDRQNSYRTATWFSMFWMIGCVAKMKKYSSARKI